MSQAAVQFDLFPAFVAVLPPDSPLPLSDLHSAPPTPGSYQIHSSRIIVTTDRVIIAKDSPTGPLPVFSEALLPGSFQKAPNSSEDSRLITISGKKLAFKKDDSCGCGSRLRSWNPMRIVGSTKDPTF